MQHPIRTGLVLVLGFSILLGAAAQAQQPASPSEPSQTARVVTEEQFLAALNDAHPAVAARREGVAVARAHLLAARVLDDPTLGIEREDLQGPTEKTELVLSWQLPGSARGLGIDARREAVAAAEARLSQDLLSLRLAMREVYADWAVAAARRELLAEQLERAEVLAQREAARAEKGESSGLEARRLALAAAALRARWALTVSVVEEARAKAFSWAPSLARDAVPALPPVLSVLSEAPPATPGASEGEHPRVLAARADVEVARLEREAAGRLVQSPEIGIGWQREEDGLVSAEGPVLGLSWTLPLLARNRPEKALAEARVSAARARLDTAQRELAAARPAAAASYRSLVAELASARESVASGAAIVRAAQAAFQHGEASLTDLLETLRSVTEAEMAVLDLHAAALAAEREVERLAAGPVVPHSSTLVVPAPQNLPGDAPVSNPQESTHD